MKDQPWGSVYEGEPFDAWSENEFYDFGLFLRVCDELGIEPLVVIEPVNGYYYDMQKYTNESRKAFNDRVRQMLDEAEVEYLDLSGHDYEKYWLRDVMHLGWKSWVEVGRALMELYGDANAEDAESRIRGDSDSASVGGAGDSTSSNPSDQGDGSQGADETEAERLAREAEEEMLEAEGAGKEVFEGEGSEQ